MEVGEGVEVHCIDLSAYESLFRCKYSMYMKLFESIIGDPAIRLLSKCYIVLLQRRIVLAIGQIIATVQLVFVEPDMNRPRDRRWYRCVYKRGYPVLSTVFISIVYPIRDADS